MKIVKLIWISEKEVIKLNENGDSTFSKAGKKAIQNYVDRMFFCGVEVEKKF